MLETAEKSRRRRILMRPESAAMKSSLVISMKVSVLRCYSEVSELMVGHVLTESGGNCSFQDFAEKMKVGDRLVVGEAF